MYSPPRALIRGFYHTPHRGRETNTGKYCWLKNERNMNRGFKKREGQRYRILATKKWFVIDQCNSGATSKNRLVTGVHVYEGYASDDALTGKKNVQSDTLGVTFFLPNSHYMPKLIPPPPITLLDSSFRKSRNDVDKLGEGYVTYTSPQPCR